MFSARIPVRWHPREPISGNLLAGSVLSGTSKVRESRTLVTDRSSFCCLLAVHILHDRLDMRARCKGVPLSKIGLRKVHTSVAVYTSSE